MKYMIPFSLSSLRFRFALLIVLAMLPVLGLTVYTDLQEREKAISNVEDDVQRTADFVAGTQEQLIEGTRQLLVALAGNPEVREYGMDFCSKHFAEMLQQYPRYSNLGAIQPNGDLFCSGTSLGPPINFASQPWFRRSIESRDLAMGVCQIDQLKARPTLNFSYPVLDDAGNPQAVVFAALDLDQINQIASEVQLPEKTEFIMVAKGGVIVAYLPDPDRWVGKSALDSPMIKTILSKGEDVTEIPGLDGVTRLYAFGPLHSTVDTELYVSLGIPVSIAYSEANRVLGHHLIGLGIVTLLALSAVWAGGNVFILRRVNALVSTAQRLSGGDMKARTGLSYGTGELDHLAHAFDDMAEALEQRAVQLRQAEVKYRTLVEQMPAIIYTARLDISRNILYVSPQVQALLGFPPEEWLEDNQLWLRQIHPDDREEVLARLSRTLARREPFCSEYRVFSKDGRLLWFNDEAIAVKDEITGEQYLQGIIRDVTENKEADEKLLNYQNQLRSLASQLSLAEEKERRRIATDLHDRVGQTLAISKIKLGLLRESSPSPDFQSSVDEIRKLVEQAIQDTRSLIFKISSPILYELGFEAALEWLAEQVQKQHGLEAHYEDDGQPKPLDDDIRVVLFQAASELLVNVVKHARATQVKVSVRKRHLSIEVTIEDDGVGFDMSEICSRWGRGEGFGLFSIRERLNHLDGRLEVVSNPGYGARVTLFAPLKRENVLRGVHSSLYTG